MQARQEPEEIEAKIDMDALVLHEPAVFADQMVGARRLIDEDGLHRNAADAARLVEFLEQQLRGLLRRHAEDAGRAREEGGDADAQLGRLLLRPGIAAGEEQRTGGGGGAEHGGAAGDGFGHGGSSSPGRPVWSRDSGVSCRGRGEEGRAAFPSPAGWPNLGGVNILSIQSWVAYGHVGNASAVFPLQRLGAEVWAVHTVQFSNHPGHGGFAARSSGIADRRLRAGIEERGVLAQCDAVLSGYIGEAGIGAAVLDAVARVKAANPRALYCCDPVIGDAGRVYVRPGIPELLRDQAMPLADIATPNQFELEWLTGAAIGTLAAAKAAVAALQARGPRCVMVTSLRTAETPDGAVDLLAGEGGRFWRLRTPRLGQSFNGAGDAIAALFLFHRLRGDAAAALAAAASSIHGLLRRTMAAGSRELLTVAAQEEFVAPTTRSWRRRC